MGRLTTIVDDEVKTQAARVCKDMGINLSAAVNMFLTQLVKNDGMPFTPTNVTRQGKDTEGYPTYRVNMSDPSIITPQIRDGAIVLPEDWDDDDDE